MISNLKIGLFNDIWAYNTSNGLWLWKGGSQSVDIPPKYDFPANPGSRECSYSWAVTGPDGGQILYLFGGITSEEDYQMDMWTYDSAVNVWTYLMVINAPSARACGASWVGVDGKLYLFGGHSMIFLFPFCANVLLFFYAYQPSAKLYCF